MHGLVKQPLSFGVLHTETDSLSLRTTIIIMAFSLCISIVFCDVVCNLHVCNTYVVSLDFNGDQALPCVH